MPEAGDRTVSAPGSHAFILHALELQDKHARCRRACTAHHHKALVANFPTRCLLAAACHQYAGKRAQDWRADLHDPVPLACSSAAESDLHMGLVPGVRVVLRPLGQLLGDDVLVQGHQPCLHLLLHLHHSNAQLEGVENSLASDARHCCCPLCARMLRFGGGDAVAKGY